jgi:hypothetical protein
MPVANIACATVLVCHRFEALNVSGPSPEKRDYRLLAFPHDDMTTYSGLGRRLVARGFYATASLPDKNSYFSIIVAMPVDSPDFRTLRWMRPRQRTLTGVA